MPAGKLADIISEADSTEYRYGCDLSGYHESKIANSAAETCSLDPGLAGCKAKAASKRKSPARTPSEISPATAH